MLNHIARVMSLVALMFMSTLSYGMTLEGLVDKHCKTGCVDSYVLLDAAAKAEEATSVDFRILLAIVLVESAFVAKAMNRGNKGLMQVLVKYHKPKFEGVSYFDVYKNVEVGAKIYRQCLDRLRSTLPAAKCYNGGGNRHYAAKFTRAYREVMSVQF